MGLKIGVQEHIAGLIIPVNNAQTMQKTEAISHTPHTLNPGPPRSRGCGHVLFLLQPLVQTAISNKLVYEEPIGPVHAIAENLNDFRVVEHTQGHHLRAKLSRAFESVWVQSLDGHGDAVREPGLVDKAEPAIADDKVFGEVFGGHPQLDHGELEGGVESKQDRLNGGVKNAIA